MKERIDSFAKSHKCTKDVFNKQVLIVKKALSELQSLGHRNPFSLVHKSSYFVRAPLKIKINDKIIFRAVNKTVLYVCDHPALLTTKHFE